MLNCFNISLSWIFQGRATFRKREGHSGKMVFRTFDVCLWEGDTDFFGIGLSFG